MTQIDEAEIDHLAELARLDLDEDQRAQYKEELQDILELAEKVNEVDTEDVPPTYHALPVENVTREDEPRPSPDARKVLDHAPDEADDYFVVPRVID